MISDKTYAVLMFVGFSTAFLCGLYAIFNDDVETNSVLQISLVIGFIVGIIVGLCGMKGLFPDPNQTEVDYLD